MESDKKKKIWNNLFQYGFPVVVIIGIVSILLGIHFYGAQLFFAFLIEHSYPGLISDESWHRAIINNPKSHGYSCFGILEDRGSDCAVETCIPLLKSRNPYIWLNVATYLGSRGRKEAIPYLIKSIRHRASFSKNERIAMLEKLTGQKFGADIIKWIKWYQKTEHPITIDWDSELNWRPPEINAQVGAKIPQPSTQKLIEYLKKPLTGQQLNALMKKYNMTKNHGKLFLLESKTCGFSYEFKEHGNLITLGNLKLHVNDVDYMPNMKEFSIYKGKLPLGFNSDDSAAKIIKVLHIPNKDRYSWRMDYIDAKNNLKYEYYFPGARYINTITISYSKENGKS